MAGVRVYIDDFALANPFYVNATVSVFTVDPETLERTTTLAPLYADLVSSIEVANPQPLDAEGKWQQPVYLDVPAIMVISGAVDPAANLTTGIAGPIGRYRGDWASETRYYTGDTVRDGAAGTDTSGIYYCAAPHTSDVFADNLADGLWLVYVDAAAITAGVIEDTLTAAQAAANAAAVSAAAALVSETAADASETNASSSASSASTQASAASASASAAAASAGSAATFMRGHIAGLTLSNDGSSPDTVLDIAAGLCIDSTNAVLISITGTITKSTAGAWAAGSGQNGMGNGLTVANSTWYHVFAIINGASRDVYFDTSIIAANKPASTTAIRRIGSFLTDGSAHISRFVQNGDRFDWNTPLTSLNATPGDTTAHTLVVTAPTGVVCEAMLSGNVTEPTAATAGVYISSLAQTDIAFGTNAVTGEVELNGLTAWSTRVMTNTAASIRYRCSAATTAILITTQGYIDTRGRFA